LKIFTEKNQFPKKLLSKSLEINTEFMMIAVTIVLSCLSCASSFAPQRIKNNCLKLHASTTQPLTWQEELDQFLDLNTACDSRQEAFRNLLSQSQTIIGEVVTAVQDQDVKKIAPPNLKYGKAVVGLQAVRRQFLNDILPEALTKSLPQLIEKGPSIIQDILAKGPERNKAFYENIREILSDPSILQSTSEELRKELKNVYQSRPDGLNGPTYDVIKDTDSYQVRFYSPYSVCSTLVDGAEGSEMPDSLASGTGFNELANYIFSEKLAMTTPVICGGGNMEFVLPAGVDSISAPVPKSSLVTIKDISSEFLAVKGMCIY
jgi:hypothetical protein